MGRIRRTELGTGRASQPGRQLQLESLEDRRLLAVDLELIKDVNTQPLGSSPHAFVEVNGVVFPRFRRGTSRA